MIRLFSLHARAAAPVLAALLASGGLVTGTATPASARVDVSSGVNVGGISFGYFRNHLGSYGQWMHHPRWGDVWRLQNARAFRPYYNGYWQYSDYGLLWVSNEPWGDIIYHYGRLVWDPQYGWLWIPGYVWSPAWVIWREGNGYLGWCPMPPDYGDFDDGPYFGGSYNWDDYYGYSDWYGLNANAFFGLWIFVDESHFYRHDYRNYVVDRGHVRNVILHTNDSTHYTTANDHIVNNSVPVERLERLTHQQIRPVPAREFIKTNVPIAPVSAGRGVARQEGSGQPGHDLHDRNFRPMKPMNVPAGNQNVPNNQNNARGNGLGGHGENATTPSGNNPSGNNPPGNNPSENHLPGNNSGNGHVRTDHFGQQTNGPKTAPSPQPQSQPQPQGESQPSPQSPPATEDNSQHRGGHKDQQTPGIGGSGQAQPSPATGTSRGKQQEQPQNAQPPANQTKQLDDKGKNRDRNDSGPG